mmetsp:Transcript_15241/g.17523  ORF Transcript_15241/g.17523 Transcript_15241/m.17523 type:complete len:90 (-) Transcript_15241:24-293(-)
MDGVNDRCLEGLCDGNKEGTKVGSGVGTIKEGVEVGSVDGMKVSPNAGVKDGAGNGDSVESNVGNGVRSAEGAKVILNVGVEDGPGNGD